MFFEILFIISVAWLALFSSILWKFYWEERDAARERQRRERERR